MDNVASLIAELSNRRWEARKAAAQELVKMGPPAIPHLVEALHHGDADVRLVAAKALGWIRNAAAVAPLTKTLGDGDSDVRRAATLALSMIADAEAVVPLVEVLGRDSSWPVRAAAAEALVS